MKKFCEWLPYILLLLIPIILLVMYACGYEIFIVNGEKYPWIVNTERLIAIDTLSNSPVELLETLKKEGLVLSPQEYSNHTHSFFSWLLTILVAVIGIVVLVFGINIDKKIEGTLSTHLKAKWLELMRIDKEVDSTIGGIIDDKVTEATSELPDKISAIEKRLKELEDNAITFHSNENE